VSLHFGNVALDICEPLDFGDLLCYLFPDAFKILLSSVLSPLRLFGIFTSNFTPSALTESQEGGKTTRQKFHERCTAGQRAS
jgi:hypothetical protein